MNCKLGVFNRSSFRCSSGYVIDTTCHGNSTVSTIFTCPPTHMVASCGTLNGNTILSKNSSCYLLAYTATTTTCACDLNHHALSTRRNLLQISNSSEEFASVSVTSLLTSISGNLESTIMSAEGLSASEIQHEWTALATFIVLIATILLLMGFGHYTDIRYSQKIAEEKSTLLSGMKTLEKYNQNLKASKVARKKNLRRLIKHTKSSEIAILEEALPQVLTEKSFVEKFSAEVKQHHRWFGVAFYYSESFPRSLRMLSLAINIIVMLFVQSITYNLVNPDNGSCSKYNTERTCLVPRSPFGTGGNMCAWRADSCSYIEPSDDFTVVLFVAVFSALISTPIAIAQNLIVQKILSAKHSDAVLVVANRKETMIRDFKHNVAVKKEMSKLITEMSFYRSTLTPKQRQEFDGKN